MSVVKGLLTTTLAFGFISLLGCSDDDDNNPPADTTDPVISNLSHVDNEKVIGSRTITFSADATDDSTLSVTITHNGTPAVVTPSGDTYSASITLEDRTNNTIVFTANDGTNTATEIVHLNYPFLSFTNGQAASVVIGQPDFDSVAYNRDGGQTPAINSLAGPRGLIVVNDKLYIADKDNERVLGFNAIPSANDPNADFVIGQDSFTTRIEGLSNTQLRSPASIAYNDNHFFVTQSGSDSRTNHWTPAPTDNLAADFVIGQADFGDGVASVCSQTTYDSNAEDITYVDGKVIVVNRSGNRVLVWNTVPSTSGVAADLVLGQQDFVHCQFNDANNDGVNDGAPTASTLRDPVGVWTDGTRLVVNDGNNRRVLIWNTFPTANGQAADMVLGQDSFITRATISPPTSSSIVGGYIVSNGNQLFISDRNNERVLIWDSWPTTNNQPADRVLGTIDFTGDVTGLSNASILKNPRAMSLYQDKLIVVDSSYNRVLIFTAP